MFFLRKKRGFCSRRAERHRGDVCGQQPRAPGHPFRPQNSKRWVTSCALASSGRCCRDGMASRLPDKRQPAVRPSAAPAELANPPSRRGAGGCGRKVAAPQPAPSSRGARRQPGLQEEGGHVLSPPGAGRRVPAPGGRDAVPTPFERDAGCLSSLLGVEFSQLSPSPATSESFSQKN